MGDQSGGDAQARYDGVAGDRAGERGGEKAMTTGSTGILPVTRPRWPWYAAGFSFLLSLVLGLWLIWAVGRNLGLFFGGLAFSALLASSLVLGETSWRMRMAVCIGIVSGIAVVWVSCIFNHA